MPPAGRNRLTNVPRPQNRSPWSAKGVSSEVEPAFQSIEKPAQPREHRAHKYPWRHFTSASWHQWHGQNVGCCVPPDVREDGSDTGPTESRSDHEASNNVASCTRSKRDR